MLFRSATAAGCTLGTDNMTAEAFACAVWVMVICSLGWIIISALFTDKMGILRDKVAGSNPAKMNVISVGGGLGAFGYQCWDRLYTVSSTGGVSFSAQTVSVIVGVIPMTSLGLYGKKNHVAWVTQFGMTISMVIGMVAGAFFL